MSLIQSPSKRIRSCCMLCLEGAFPSFSFCSISAWASYMSVYVLCVDCMCVSVSLVVVSRSQSLARSKDAEEALLKRKAEEEAGVIRH